MPGSRPQRGAGPRGGLPVTLAAAEATMACVAVDPAVLLVAVGVLTFLITFCGCVGSLRENICLLQTVSVRHCCRGPLAAPRRHHAPLSRPQFSACLTIVFLLQLAVGVLGFVFSDKVPPGWGVLGAPQPVPLGEDPADVPPCHLAGAWEGQRDHQRCHRALPGRPGPAEPHRLWAEGGAGWGAGEGCRPPPMDLDVFPLVGQAEIHGVPQAEDVRWLLHGGLTVVVKPGPRLGRAG